MAPTGVAVILPPSNQGDVNMIEASNIYEGMSREVAAVVLAVGASDGPGERLAALFDAHEDRLYRLGRR